MRKITLLFALFLSGCSMVEKVQERQVRFLKGNAQSSDLISLDEEKEEKAPPKTLNQLLEIKIQTPDERNLEQSKLLTKSEVNCSTFIEQTHFNRAMMNVSFSLYSNIASTAAAIVSGRAGQNLAGLSSVLGFTSDSLNQEMYSGVLMPALVREITQSRADKLKKIRDQQKEDLKIYPYPLAIMDALQYHNLCSIPVALTSLINKSDSIQSLDYTSQINSIDNEIRKQTTTLKDTSLGLSKTEQDALRQNILDLTKRRELMTLVLPHIKTQESANASKPEVSGAQEAGSN